MMIINIALFGPIGLTIWAVQTAWMPIMAAGIINGVGHYWGYGNFACEDASTNILPWGILIGGEELHNNHRNAYGTSARLSNKWYEFDIGWLYIKLMSYVGLATIRKVAPTVKWQPAKPLCDLDTLQAIITHRYDVMTRFVKSVRDDSAAEIARLKAGSNLPQNWNLNSFKRWLYKEPNTFRGPPALAQPCRSPEPRPGMSTSRRGTQRQVLPSPQPGSEQMRSDHDEQE